MDRVLTERPRAGGIKKVKGYKKRLRRSLDGDYYTKHERMIDSSFDTEKHFTDVLGPLYGYLLRQVGRKWDDVYSEIREHMSPNNRVHNHLFTHLYQFLERNVILINGLPYHLNKMSYSEGEYTPLESRQNLYGISLYVCPKDGVIKRAPEYKEKIVKKKKSWFWADEEKLQQYHLLSCGKKKILIWFLVQMAPIVVIKRKVLNNLPGSKYPESFYFYDVNEPKYDHVLHRSTEGQKYYGLWKRQISGKELRNVRKQYYRAD